MDVRRRLATGPWPARVALTLALSAVACWPLLLWDRDPPWVALFWGVAGGLIAPALQRRQDARETGWTATEQDDIVRAAHAGTLPADPTDRETLRVLVRRYAREQRPAPVLFGGCFGVLAVVLAEPWAGIPGPGRLAAAAYYVLLGAGLVTLMRRRQARRERLLALLASVEGGSGG